MQKIRSKMPVFGFNNFDVDGEEATKFTLCTHFGCEQHEAKKGMEAS
jgi:hypothetical protein